MSKIILRSEVPRDRNLMFLARTTNGGTGAAVMTDMDIAEKVFRAIRENRIELRFEPVCSAENSHVVLYSECLTSVLDDEEGGISPLVFVPALERLQLIRAFDRYVVRRVIDTLKADRDVILGVNISGSSAVADEMWAPCFIDLAGRPEVADRLVVEITEAVPLQRGRGRQFGRRLRELGCSVAVDDFGVGHGIDTAMEIDSPDVVKIDASLLAGIGKSEFSISRLHRLVALASEIADHVVIEGVEKESDLSLVRTTGAKWVQGFLFKNMLEING